MYIYYEKNNKGNRCGKYIIFMVLSASAISSLRVATAFGAGCHVSCGPVFVMMPRPQFREL